MLNDSLEVIANHDSMTRLQNRYALNQQIPGYLDTDICIAMIDINSFKSINDTYGHNMGDITLKAFSDLLLQCFPRDDIYRYGGDEFLVIYRSDHLEAFRSALAEMNRKFGEIHFDEVKESFSCCYGCVSDHPMNPTDFFDLIMQADKKLYEEKNKLKSGAQ